MFFGAGSKPTPPAVPQDSVAPAPSPAANNGSPVFDVGVADFEARVIQASMQVPVLVDFWAPWCGPCKQLGPALEKIVQAAGGKILLAKVNLDENQELAAALRVQSVPTVYAFFGGQPVDAFQGALPESQLQAFVDKIIEGVRQAMPDALDIPAALTQAAEALSAGDMNTAHGLYSRILQEDQKNAPAYVGLVRTFIAAGQLEQARQLVDNAPVEISSKPEFAQAKSALELAEVKPESANSAEQAVLKDPDDHQARIDLARAQFAAGDKEVAIDNLLESIRRDREWEDQAARKALLKFFEALGHGDPLSVQGRRKLSAVLFS